MAIQAVLNKVIEGERGNTLVALLVPLLVISGSPRPCFASRDRRRPHDAYYDKGHRPRDAFWCRSGFDKTYCCHGRGSATDHPVFQLKRSGPSLLLHTLRERCRG